MARKPKASPVKAEEADDRTDQPRSSERWIQEIDASLQREETWRTRAKEVVKRYRDERSTKSEESRVNILWSNTEVLKAALYARQAKPDVRRRFPDAKKGNQISRYVAETIERGLIYCNDVYDIDAPIEAAIEDMLLPGRGIVSVEYDPVLSGEGETEEISEQKLRVRFHYWEDFTHGLARKWCDVPWVGFRHALRKNDFEAKFPKAKAAPDQPDYELKDASGSRQETTEKDKFVEVWEIWDKGAKERLYVARGYENVLQADDDPLGLEGFFPCPRPLYSVTTTDTLKPEPEFCQYQDQANELNIVSTRIRVLTEQLQWKGIYDGSIDGENVLVSLAGAGDGEFLPYANWAHLKEKGGIESGVGFWPMEKIIPVLQVLDARQASLVQKIYEITGISDIIRGATDPRETKGAQQLKAQFGSMRMQRRQRDVQRFIRDLYRIKAEIIAEHFTADNLAAITQFGLPTKAEQEQAKQMMAMQQAQAAQAQPMGPAGAPQGMPGGLPPPAAPPAPPPVPPELQMMLSLPAWDDVIAALRSDKLRGYAVDVETDSTVMQDAEAEKAQRIEAATALRDALQGAYVAATTAPKTLPLIKEMTLFVMRTFKGGRVMEQAVEDAFDELEKNPPPPPQEANAKPDTSETDKAKLELEAKKASDANRLEQQRIAIDAKDKAERLELDKQRMLFDQQTAAERTRIEQQNRDQDRADKGLPDISQAVVLAGQMNEAMAANTMQMQALVAQNTAAMQQVTETLTGLMARVDFIGNGLTTVAQRVDEIAALESAPVEIVRGRDGRPTGVRKGGAVRAIRRDAQGRPAGLQ